MAALPGQDPGTSCDPDLDAACQLAKGIGDVSIEQALGPRELPAGEVDEASLYTVMDGLAQEGRSIVGLFGLLADGKHRRIDGRLLADVFTSYHIVLPWLPIDNLTDVTSGGGFMTLRFDFGDDETKDMTLPEQRYTVVVSKDEEAPLAARKPNELKTRKLDSKKVRIRNELRYTVGPEGILSVRDGDMEVKCCWVAWPNLRIRTEHKPGRVWRDDKGDVVIETDGDGNPVIRNGSYVPLQFDDWNVIGAADVEIRRRVRPLQPRDRMVAEATESEPAPKK